MPVMDGLEATKRIRQLPGGDNVKIVAVTASVFREQEPGVLAGGLDGFIRKSYRSSEIYDTLSRQIGMEFVYRSENIEAGKETFSESLCQEMFRNIPGPLLTSLNDALRSLEAHPLVSGWTTQGLNQCCAHPGFLEDLFL